MNAQLVHLKKQEADGTVGISDVHQLEESTKFTDVGANLGFDFSETGGLDLGIFANHFNPTYGEFSLKATSFIDPSESTSYYYGINDSKFAPNITFMYNYPVFQIWGTKEEAPILLADKAHANQQFKTIYEAVYRYALNIRGGMGTNHFRATNENYLYNELSNQYENVQMDGSLDNRLRTRQNVLSTRIGVSFSQTFGTSFKARAEGYNFDGILSRKLSFYADALIMLNNPNEELTISYRYFDGNNTVNETRVLQPFEQVKRGAIGVAGGFNYRYWSDPYMKVCMSVNLELGILPGYKESFSSGTYFQSGIIFGFGSVKR